MSQAGAVEGRAVTPEERTEWQAKRLTGIGASDVAAARTGLYGGAARVVGIRIGLPDPDPIDPDLAARGHRWEPAIADGVLAHHGLYVYNEQSHLAHPDHPRWMCTPDGLLAPTPAAAWPDFVSGLEIKTRRVGAHWQWDHWETQSKCGILVTGLPRWLIAVATIDEQLDPVTMALAERLVDVTYRWVTLDPLDAAQLADTYDGLWAWVERGELPPVDDPSALPWVKTAHADADPDAAADIDDLADDIARWHALKDAAKKARDEVDLLEARIRDRMGAATEAVTTDGTWRVRCGQPIRRFTDASEADALTEHPDLTVIRFDRGRLKTERPADYDRLKRPTADRRLTIKQLKETP